MIPKIIHYCWFGAGSKSRLIKKCIASWQKYLPDYEFVLWNESNFDLSRYPFAKEAYDCRKYAFVADVARLHALTEYGGIYLDTDVEVLRSFDNLLALKAFIGFEQTGVIQTGVIGAEPHHHVIEEMLEYYIRRGGFDRVADGTVANSTLFADYFKRTGIPLTDRTAHYESISLFASECFCPINQATQEIVVTPQTYCIHYLAGSWLPVRDRFTRWIKSYMGNWFGFGFIDKARRLLGRK